MCLEFVVLDAVAGRIRLNKMDGAVDLVDPGFQVSNDTFLPRNRRFELVPTLQNVGRRPLDRHFLMGPVAGRNVLICGMRRHILVRHDLLGLGRRGLVFLLLLALLPSQIPERGHIGGLSQALHGERKNGDHGK